MHKKTKQALAIGVITLAISALAHAETSYCINGKVVSAGEATRTALKAPGTKIIKVQVSQVTLNDETMRLKKASDIKLSNPCAIK